MFGGSYRNPSPPNTTKKREYAFWSPSLCFKHVNYEVHVRVCKTKHSIYTKRLFPTLANWLTMFTKSFAVFCNADMQQMNTAVICDKSVTTQNLTFLSYWYRKKSLQMHF